MHSHVHGRENTSIPPPPPLKGFATEYDHGPWKTGVVGAHGNVPLILGGCSFLTFSGKHSARAQEHPLETSPWPFLVCKVPPDWAIQ